MKSFIRFIVRWTIRLTVITVTLSVGLMTLLIMSSDRDAPEIVRAPVDGLKSDLKVMSRAIEAHEEAEEAEAKRREVIAENNRRAEQARRDRIENFEIKARVFCANQIENVMRDPKFSIGVFDTPQVQPAKNNGRLFIWRGLSSRNGFGMDVKVTAHCAVDGDGNLIVLMVNGRDMLQ